MIILNKDNLRPVPNHVVLQSWNWVFEKVRRAISEDCRRTAYFEFSDVTAFFHNNLIGTTKRNIEVQL